ncbi:hypothetical protein JCM11491_000876 [Sporobolomyces phaffii]
MHVSLEPLPISANDGHDGDVFARPARLADVVLQDGSELYSRVDPRKSLQERLMRVWAERGDYSLVTHDSIRNPARDVPDDADHAAEDPLGRPSPDEMRKFAETMLNNLAIARGELSTALDLLNVLSPATDPPNVDVNTIPLPHEALTLVPTAVPPAPSYSDPRANPLAPLPLAESLESIRRSARLFFEASEHLVPLDDDDDARRTTSRKRTKAPDPWPTILSLHAASPARSLVPLGALPGATLTGKHEVRAAREVGVFYGCEEAAREFRRASVAAIGELVHPDVERGGGRRFCLEVHHDHGDGDDRDASVERHVWDDDDGRRGRRDDRRVEAILERRNRSAFAEELFAKLVHEAKTDSSLGAQYKVRPTSPLESTSSAGSGSTPIVSLLSPFLRLLFLQEYSDRRLRTPRGEATHRGGQQQQPQHGSGGARPVLATAQTFLRYLDRVDSVRAVLERVSNDLRREVEVEVETELWTGERQLSLGARDKDNVAAHPASSRDTASGDVLRTLLRGTEPELGGRALVTLNKRHTFHILFSLPLPGHSASAMTTGTGTKPSSLLTLRSPGKAHPVSIPSMRHLEGFLRSELARVLDKDGHRLNL